MDELPSIHFFIDEHLPAHLLSRILIERGHRVTPVQIGFKDPAILMTADQVGAVIVTADHWFLRELFRLPIGHRQRYARAGVVQVPGEWDVAEPRIRDYLPTIEAIYRLRRGQEDQRVGIDISQATVRILEAKPLAPHQGRTR